MNGESLVLWIQEEERRESRSRVREGREGIKRKKKIAVVGIV